ncbi:hypothetical protein FA13DRAFT_242387 [Coprinellus micaceus]|uniref:SWIM-type domain-containing protein n=1 Tax=Coprinellus micaceus TaxID=71717 RepID=A0A4Y7SEY2_COPMI|nr:hypothetical protein FA13DRAFT_242387 [Coprinellus micaceus]
MSSLTTTPTTATSTTSLSTSASSSTGSAIRVTPGTAFRRLKMLTPMHGSSATTCKVQDEHLMLSYLTALLLSSSPPLAQCLPPPTSTASITLKATSRQTFIQSSALRGRPSRPSSGTCICLPAPESFEQRWSALIDKYPLAEQYLAELYGCKERWAYAWVMTMFTAGTRTNGRVESENRVKGLGGPKKNFKQFVEALNERSGEQTVNDMIEVRQTKRRQHDRQVEGIFSSILDLVRAHTGPLAVQVVYWQMQDSMYYQVELVQLPHGSKKWDARALLLYTERTFAWEDAEETKMMNTFKNDAAHISPCWLLQRAIHRGLNVTHIIRITHLSSRMPHYLLVLSNDQYMCDCAMGLNLGLPCRHFFHAWTTFKGLCFQLGLIRRRWLKDPSLDLLAIPTVAFNHAGALLQPNASALPSLLLLNPLETVAPHFTASATQTIGAHEVNHEANAALRPLLDTVQTVRELEDVLEDLRALKRSRLAAEQEGNIPDPSAPLPKGRPRTARITSGYEGRPRGGGPTNSAFRRVPAPALHPSAPAAATSATPSHPSDTANTQRRCGRCREVGHNRTRCPMGP